MAILGILTVRQRDRVSAKALDRRGRMALHMAETAAEKEAKWWKGNQRTTVFIFIFGYYKIL